MCRCKAKITQSECDMLREFYRDGRTFIFNISTKNGLRVAYVPKNMNPNQIAIDRGFFNDEGEIEWFSLIEHPCIQEIL